MAIEKVIDINIQSNAEEAVGSLRTQLKQAQAEVATMSEKFGVTSVEAANAAKKAAELKDKIGDAKALTDAFNPDAKFKALTSSLAGVAGGFAALQGGMALFGGQSKEVEQTLLKVQSAMALSQGLQQVGESVDSFKQLGAVAKSYTITQKIVTAGQWLWNAAMAANPIVAIVAGIAALIAAGVALVNYFKESSAAAAKNTAAVDHNKKALESQTKTLERNSSELDKKQSQELAMAKASGASAASIRALEIKLIDEKIAYEKSARAIAFNTYEKNKNYLASLKASGADDEVIKKQQETTNKSILEYNKQNQNVQKAFDERRDIQNRHQVEIRQSQTNHNKEFSDKAKEHSQKLKDDAKEAATKKAEEEAAALKKVADDKLAADMDSAKKAMEILDSLKPKETPAEKENREYLEKKAILEANNLSTEELTKQHLTNLKEIDDNARLKDDEKKASDLEKIINDSNSSYEAKIEAIDAEQALYQKQLDDKVITEEQYNDKVKGLAKSREDIAKAEAAAKAALFAKTSETLNKGADLLGKNTAAGKAMAAAAALINTYQGISAELATKTTTPFEIGLKIANVAIIAATGFKAVKDIIATPIPGGGGGEGGATAPTGGGGMTAPSFNVVGPSGPNQIAQSIANQDQQPVQAFVVAGAVTTGQALNRNIINNASMG
jgi:myosin heavy subunit